MTIPVCYKLLKNNLWLSPERMIYWEEERSLIVADLHFGKTGHFRKAGIAVPPTVYKEDLQRLVSQIQHFQPDKLIVVGDMFHSVANKELDFFKKWRDDFPNLSINLVKGNHDILDTQWYMEAGINLINEILNINTFSFIHDAGAVFPAEPLASRLQASTYYFSGHIHPGVRIAGMGKQNLQFPCFYFSQRACILPAFSRFTGMATVKPGQGDQVFAIVNKTIIPF